MTRHMSFVGMHQISMLLCSRFSNGAGVNPSRQGQGRRGRGREGKGGDRGGRERRVGGKERERERERE